MEYSGAPAARQFPVFLQPVFMLEVYLKCLKKICLHFSSIHFGTEYVSEAVLLKTPAYFTVIVYRQLSARK